LDFGRRLREDEAFAAFHLDPDVVSGEYSDMVELVHRKGEYVAVAVFIEAAVLHVCSFLSYETDFDVEVVFADNEGAAGEGDVAVGAGNIFAVEVVVHIK
jgi:hypothetical protein